MIQIKALVYLGPNDVKYQEIEGIKTKPKHAKIKIKYCGICGGDRGIVAGTHPRAMAPLVIGHEFVGVIEEISENSNNLKVGDRVVAYPLISCGTCLPCRTGNPHICKDLKLLGIDMDGAMAEYALVHESALFKVNDNVSDEVAALIEPLAVIVRAVHQSQFKLLDSAVVMGAGPIGLITAIVLKYAGVSKIVVSDLDNSRIQLCRDLGFRAVNIKEENLKDVVDKMTDCEGVDVVFESSGTEPATFKSTEIAKIGGMICMTGIHKAPNIFNLPEFSFKEQKIVATRVYTKHEFEQAVNFAEKVHDELKKLVSHIIPLREGYKAFDYINNPNVNTVKVLIDCTDV